MDILKLRRAICLTTCYCILFLLPWISHAQAGLESNQKQRVKAAAIYKFINFVEWPKTDVNTKHMLICLLKSNAAFNPFKGRVVNGKSIQVKVLKNTDEIKDCHVIYLNAENYLEILNQLEKKQHPAILTISDNPSFMQQGGIIQLGAKNNRLQFRINRVAAQQGKLNIAYQLLSLADTVIDH